MGIALATSGLGGIHGGASLPPDIPDATYSQSTVYDANGVITNAKMTDLGVSGNLATSWAATGRVVGSWLASSFASSTVNGVKVQTGSPPGWGPISPYLNGVEVQTLTGGTWATRATISGLTDSPSAIYLITFSPVADVTGLRLLTPSLNWLATALLIPQRV